VNAEAVVTIAADRAGADIFLATTAQLNAVRVDNIHNWYSSRQTKCLKYLAHDRTSDAACRSILRMSLFAFRWAFQLAVLTATTYIEARPFSEKRTLVCRARSI
jgi:hypothetical protein